MSKLRSVTKGRSRLSPSWRDVGDPTVVICTSAASFARRRLRCVASNSVEQLPAWSDAQASFQELYRDVRLCDYSGLRYLVKNKRDLFTTSFVSWLASMEKEASGELQDALARCCVTIMALTSEVDADTMKGVLPEIAGTLASYNYETYKEVKGVQLPSPVKGANLETLYSFSQHQERQLNDDSGKKLPSGSQTMPNTSQTYQIPAAARRPTSSARPRQYSDMAESIMAHAKMRMQALQGQKSNVAAEILAEFIHHMYSREERCTVLPEAMTPPGIQLSRPSNEQDSFLHTTPSDLMEVIDEWMQILQGEEQDAGILESGEKLCQVLQEMKEDVQEYDIHIYSQMSKLAQLGDLQSMF